jgi:hypothetical protein
MPAVAGIILYGLYKGMRKMSATCLSRRDFLKGAGSVAALSFLGCAPTREELMAHLNSLPPAIAAPPVVYPRLPGNKVQAPENGCYVGMRKFSMDPTAREEARKQSRNLKNLDELVAWYDDPDHFYDKRASVHVTNHLEYYKDAFGRYPGIFVLSGHPKLFANFPYYQACAITTKGAIPYVN